MGFETLRANILYGAKMVAADAPVLITKIPYELFTFEDIDGKDVSVQIAMLELNAFLRKENES